MVQCPVCSNHFETNTSLLSHLQFFHSDFTASCNLGCPHPGCVRTYNEFKSFSKHVNGHKIDIAPKRQRVREVHNLPNLDISAGEDRQHDEDLNSIPEELSSNEPEITSHDFDDALVNAVITFLASLYDSSTLSEQQIQEIVEGHQLLLQSGFLSTLKKKVFCIFDKFSHQKEVQNQELKEVDRMFDSFQNMYSGFHTPYLRLKEFEKCGSYIAPESYVIGNARDERNTHSTVVVTPIELTGQFVPMRKVLKGFLELPGVLKTILDYKLKLEQDTSGVLSNIVQAKLWTEKIKPKFVGKTVLPLIFYFDDYETNKEKGTHTGVHKLGATYYHIACLPPEYLSLLENKFLANLFHSGDKAFGNAAVFRKVLNELKFLEKNGIVVVTADGAFQIYFALCLFTGDNLGANGVLGFVESFSANFCCRVCKDHKSVMRVQTVSNPQMRRNKEDHLNDVTLKNDSQTGVKEECIFDELSCFDVAENAHLDITHDLDEGVWKYLMIKIIKYMLRSKRFTLDILNNLVQGFYYGRSEKGNKPVVLTERNLKEGTLPFSATEMRCFMRHFGFMVGHLVTDEDEEVWNLYLTARKIIDLVTAPFFALSNIDRLRNLIRDHNQSYMDLFGDHLYPKMHFMTHEPDLIPEIGPLEPLSCLRGEGKHKEGKDIAHISSNRINLPFTVAKRHQLRYCFRLVAGRGLVNKISSSPSKVVFPSHLKDFVHFQSCLTEGDIKEWNLVSWVSVNNTKYHEKMAVVLCHENHLPQFGYIHTIVLYKDGPAFLVKLLKTNCFDDHVHAFEVSFSNCWGFVKQSNLGSYFPCDIQRSSNGKSYVCLRYSLS